MPTYDYVCDACGHALEIFHSITETPKKKCPKCGKPKLTRKIGAGAGILFKGGGFYQTDYRSDSYKAAHKAETEASTPSAPTSVNGSDAKKSDGEKPSTPKTESSPSPVKSAASESRSKKSKKKD
jgi:putative FmdB family regulatory protein